MRLSKLSGFTVMDNVPIAKSMLTLVVMGMSVLAVSQTKRYLSVKICRRMHQID